MNGLCILYKSLGECNTQQLDTKQLIYRTKNADAIDQIFLDLALKMAPCLLLSKDNEILKLKKQAAHYSVFIRKTL